MQSQLCLLCSMLYCGQGSESDSDSDRDNCSRLSFPFTFVPTRPQRCQRGEEAAVGMRKIHGICKAASRPSGRSNRMQSRITIQLRSAGMMTDMTDLTIAHSQRNATHAAARPNVDPQP